MSYCYCTPSRSLSWNMVMGTKGYRVDATRSEASRRGWETRRRREEMAELERKAAEARRLAMETPSIQPMVITGTVPASTVVDAPVAIEIEGD